MSFYSSSCQLFTVGEALLKLGEGLKSISTLQIAVMTNIDQNFIEDAPVVLNFHVDAKKAQLTQKEIEGYNLAKQMQHCKLMNRLFKSMYHYYAEGYTLTYHLKEALQKVVERGKTNSDSIKEYGRELRKQRKEGLYAIIINTTSTSSTSTSTGSGESIQSLERDSNFMCSYQYIHHNQTSSSNDHQQQIPNAYSSSSSLSSLKSSSSSTNSNNHSFNNGKSTATTGSSNNNNGFKPKQAPPVPNKSWYQQNEVMDRSSESNNSNSSSSAATTSQTSSLASPSINEPPQLPVFDLKQRKVNSLLVDKPQGRVENSDPYHSTNEVEYNTPPSQQKPYQQPKQFSNAPPVLSQPQTKQTTFEKPQQQPSVVTTLILNSQLQETSQFTQNDERHNYEEEENEQECTSASRTLPNSQFSSPHGNEDYEEEPPIVEEESYQHIQKPAKASPSTPNISASKPVIQSHSQRKDYVQSPQEYEEENVIAHHASMCPDKANPKNNASVSCKLPVPQSRNFQQSTSRQRSVHVSSITPQHEYSQETQPSSDAIHFSHIDKPCKVSPPTPSTNSNSWQNPLKVPQTNSLKKAPIYSESQFRNNNITNHREHEEESHHPATNVVTKRPLPPSQFSKGSSTAASSTTSSFHEIQQASKPQTSVQPFQKPQSSSISRKPASFTTDESHINNQRQEVMPYAKSNFSVGDGVNKVVGNSSPQVMQLAQMISQSGIFASKPPPQINNNSTIQNSSRPVRTDDTESNDGSHSNNCSAYTQQQPSFSRSEEKLLLFLLKNIEIIHKGLILFLYLSIDMTIGVISRDQ